MATSSEVEYIILRYVPNVLSDKHVAIATIFISFCDRQHMILEQDWQSKVGIVDPDADMDMLRNLLDEIRRRLYSATEGSEMIRKLEDSFSNVLQVSERRCVPVSEPLEDLLQKNAAEVTQHSLCFS